jgi:hypothetical protein
MRSCALVGYHAAYSGNHGVSGQHIGPILEGQEIQEGIVLHFLTLESVADRLSRNVRDYHCTLRDIQKSEYFRVTPILHLLL